MNALKKVYCRTYQSVLKFLHPHLPYRDPVELKDYESVVDILKEQGRLRPLIITDKVIRENGLLGKIEVVLKENNIRYQIFDTVDVNPTVSNVEEALIIYRRHHCNAIIAVGGGSPIDCAKALGARVVRPKRRVKDFQGLLKVFKKLPTFIAIPTTVGTGSETTLTSVITDHKTHHKFTINDFELIPHFTILDPELIVSLPPFLTATTALDALTHAVESYIGRSTSLEVKKLAREAIMTILANIEEAFEDPKNIEAKEKLLRASHIAGKAFSRAYVGYVHAVAHSLGGEYGIAHGLANAVIMPVVLEKYGDSVEQDLYELAVASGLIEEDSDLKKGAQVFIENLKRLNRKFGLSETFDEIKLSDISKMARYADREANPLYPVPRLMDQRELETIYLKIKTPKI